MKLPKKEALEIVLELAEQNKLTEREARQEIDLLEEYKRQEEAIKQVKGFFKFKLIKGE